MFEDCETRDGVDETEIDPVVKQIQRCPMYSPERQWMPWHPSSPETFDLHLDFNACMPTTPPTPPIIDYTHLSIRHRVTSSLARALTPTRLLKRKKQKLKKKMGKLLIRVEVKIMRAGRNTRISRDWDLLYVLLFKMRITPQFQAAQEELPISTDRDVWRIPVIRKRTTLRFQNLQELPAEHDLSQADISNHMPGSSISYHDVLPQETSLIEDNRLSPASPDLCIGNGPAKDLSSSSMHKESLEAGGGWPFQMTESTPSAAYPTPFSDQGGMLSENVGSSNDLRYLSPSAPEAIFEGQIPESTETGLPCSDPALKQAMAILPHSVPHVTTRTIGETETGTPRCCSASEIELLGKVIPSSTRPTLTDEETMKQKLQFLTESTAQHDLQRACHTSKSVHAERSNRMRVNISNQELLLEQKTPLSARDLTGSSTCNESEGDFIARCTFQIQELPSAAGSTYAGLMTSENVGISLNNLTISAAEAFPNHSSKFTTSETFKTRYAAESWCREVGRSNGFKVVVGRSDSGKLTKIERSTLLCERSGSYRAQGKNTELHQDKKLMMIATKKCECPFKLKCQTTNGSWTVQVICGKHNHQCFENLELQRKKIPSSCNIPSIGGQDEAGCQMFDSSLTTNEGYPREKNRFQPNFGEGSSRLRTVNASNVESRETPTSQTTPERMLTFSDPAQNQVMTTLSDTVPHSTATQNEITGVTATYGNLKVKLPHSSLSGIVQLKEQVAKRFELELGTFRVEYQEDEEVFLIACDEALQECVEFSSSSRNGQISLLVTKQLND